jgi:hypothetical protein
VRCTSARAEYGAGLSTSRCELLVALPSPGPKELGPAGVEIANDAATVGVQEQRQLARHEAEQPRLHAAGRDVLRDPAQHHLLGLEAPAPADDAQAREQLLGAGGGGGVVVRAGVEGA